MSYVVVFVIGFAAGSAAYCVATHDAAQAKIAAGWTALVAKFRSKKK